MDNDQYNLSAVPMPNPPPHDLTLDEIFALIRKNYGEALDKL